MMNQQKKSIKSNVKDNCKKSHITCILETFSTRVCLCSDKLVEEHGRNRQDYEAVCDIGGF